MYLSISRLKVVNAVLLLKTPYTIKNELQLKELDEYFWTDSSVMLGFIANNAKSFTAFFGNRVSVILKNSNVEEWKYIPSNKNPSDDSFVGMNFKIQ